ncbi:MAG: hypothetical protein LE168_01835 [Endomicrobium sp.]|nr:hypothetical protein [Endomicrobium sp.]
MANVIRSCGSENDSKEIFVRINNRTKEGKSEVWGQARAAYTKYSGDDNSLSGYTDNENDGLIGCDKYEASMEIDVRRIC